MLAIASKTSMENIGKNHKNPKNHIVTTTKWMARKPSYYNAVILSAMASEITGVPIAYSTVCSHAGHRKHQSSASLEFPAQRASNTENVTISSHHDLDDFDRNFMPIWNGKPSLTNPGHALIHSLGSSDAYNILNVLHIFISPQLLNTLRQHYNYYIYYLYRYSVKTG